MTSSQTTPVTQLTLEESWQLLSSVTFGHLGTSIAGQPEIFPINYAVAEQAIYFRTAEGTKLLSTIINGQVVFEADEHDADGAWSVVVKGLAHVLTSADDIAWAENLPLRPWVPTVKQRWVRISVTEISGRRFHFGPEPEREVYMDSVD